MIYLAAGLASSAIPCRAAVPQNPQIRDPPYDETEDISLVAGRSHRVGRLSRHLDLRLGAGLRAEDLEGLF